MDDLRVCIFGVRHGEANGLHRLKGSDEAGDCDDKGKRH